MTHLEFLKAYDNDEGVSSIIMGFGKDGYELAIQKGAIEVLRSAIEQNYSADSDEDMSVYKKICNDKITLIDDELGGLTGAMFDALSWLSFQWYTKGIDWVINMAKEKDQSHRIITVFSDHVM